VKTLAFVLAAALLAGCTGIRTIESDVSSFGDWPAARQPGTYAFDRLPSQQAIAEQTAKVEDAARAALEKAGFKPAAEGAQPDVLVQVAARVNRADAGVWDDPLWWRGGFGYWRYSPWPGPYWSLSARYDRLRYELEVALLLRDRESGKPLFEARASNESSSGLSREQLGAMFEAAMMDFPKLGPNPRRVVVQLPPSS